MISAIAFKHFVRRPLAVALLVAAAAFAWQTLTVRYSYGGNWTALFCAGADFRPAPAALASENIYLHPHSFGYDGQMYHYAAHDPFLMRGFADSMDAPRFRYRRILVPAAAWLLAAGQDRLIDAAYYAVVLGCVFLTAFWVAALAVDCGAPALWGVAVLLVPAVAVSIDRMTVDVALAACTAGVVLFSRRSRWPVVFVLCAVAGLVRETGLMLPAGIALWAAVHRRFRLAGAVALSSVPTFGWYAWTAARTAPYTETLLSVIPFAGLLRRFASPYPYPSTASQFLAATLLDYVALAGVALAVVYVAILVRKLWPRPEGFIAFAFVALVAVTANPGIWLEPWAFGRAFSPLLMLGALDGLAARSWAGALPLALVAPRIALQFGPQILNILHGLTAG